MTFSKAVETFRALGCAVSEVKVPFEKASFDIKNIEQDRNTIAEVLFKDIDVLLLPTVAELTPTIDDAKNRENSKAGIDAAFSPKNTFFCNDYGLPAIIVPCGFDNSGLPLGLQLVAPQGGEGTVLEVANRYQNVTQFHLRHPSVSGGKQAVISP